MQWVGWILAILGIWLICAPFALGYSGTSGALWNDIIVGLLTGCFGTWAAIAFRKK